MKTRRHRFQTLMVFTIVLSVVVAACGNDDEGSDEPIKIGYAAAVTGELAPYDSPDGVQCAIDRVNEDGGVLGRQLELIVRDVASDPVQGGTVAEELLDEGVTIILGPPTDDTALPVAQVAAEEDTAVLTVTATQPNFAISAPGNGFMTAYGDNSSAAAAAEHAYDQGYRSAWLMVTRDIGSYGIVTANAFGDTFAELGGEVVGESNWEYGVGDFSSQITEIAASDPVPDVVFLGGPVPDNATFARQMRDAGVEAAYYGTDGFDDPAFIEVGEEAVEGASFATLGFPEPGGDLEEFFDDCQERGYDVRNIFTGMGGDAVAVVVAAIEGADSADSAEVLDALKGLEEVEGVVSSSITYKDQGGVPLRNIAVVQVVEGEFALDEYVIPSYVPEPRS